MNDKQGSKAMIEKIVLTGAGGKLGRRMRLPLSKLCRHLVSTDIVPLEPIVENEIVSMVDLKEEAEVNKLTQGADSIVHFAGYPREAEWSTLLNENILTSTNLWESARLNNVRRIVYASTNHVVGFHPVDRHIDIHAEVKCDSRYGVSKAFTEIMARFYYEKYGIESLGIRIGRCEDLPSDERMLATWVHPDDLAEIVRLGIQCQVEADILYGISNNSKAMCSNPVSARLLYKPQHSADDYVLDVNSSQPQSQTSWLFQGGPYAENGYVGDKARAGRLSPISSKDQ